MLAAIILLPLKLAAELQFTTIAANISGCAANISAAKSSNEKLNNAAKLQISLQYAVK